MLSLMSKVAIGTGTSEDAPSTPLLNPMQLNAALHFSQMPLTAALKSSSEEKFGFEAAAKQSARASRTSGYGVSASPASGKKVPLTMAAVGQAHAGTS
jgi:hypothetical protein